MADIALDVGQRNGVFLAAETDGVALGAGACSASDAMHIIFRVIRQVEVKHVAHVGNVQAARGHIGGDQHRDIAVMKIAHHFQAFGLRHVARQGLRREAVRDQRTLQHFRHTLGVDEHHGAARIDAPEQTHEQRDFFVGGGEVEHLGHPVHRHLVRFDANQFRIVHVLVRQFHDPVRQGGRKHHGEAQRGMRHAAQYKADILDKAEIEHPIGLIQDRHLDVPQIEHMLLEIIDDPARRADQNIDAFLEGAPLLLVIDAAEHNREPQAGVLGYAQCVGMNLDREFARRRNHNGARRIDRTVRRPRVGQQAIEQGDQKGRRLAGAGLRLAGHVAAG